MTEISWDTKPADPKGVPSALHARWVSEMLYRLWRLNVGSVTWFQLEGPLPRATSAYQSGLHPVNGIANNRKKLSHTAFRFPFVAFVAGSKVRIWGRTPPGAPAQTVVIERRTPSTGWRRVATTRAQSTGIFGRLITMTRVGFAPCPHYAAGRGRLGSVHTQAPQQSAHLPVRQLTAGWAPRQPPALAAPRMLA